jgi:drug/metabolite transporter (DMT)-like permease
VLVLAAEVAFSAMGAAVKVLSGELPSEVIVFFRNLIGLLVLLPWWARRGRGALVEKRCGYYAERRFSYSWNAMKAHHLLMRLAVLLLKTLARFTRDLAPRIAARGMRPWIACESGLDSALRRPLSPPACPAPAHTPCHTA